MSNDMSSMIASARGAIVNAFAVDRGVVYPRTRTKLVTTAQATAVASGSGWSAYVQSIFSIDDNRESQIVPKTVVVPSGGGTTFIGLRVHSMDMSSFQRGIYATHFRNPDLVVASGPADLSRVATDGGGTIHMLTRTGGSDIIVRVKSGFMGGYLGEVRITV